MGIAVDPARAARHLYDAECALHAARQSRVDEWIAAAYDRLHEAVEAHRAATASNWPSSGVDAESSVVHHDASQSRSRPAA
jgi:hypothetical protein